MTIKIEVRNQVFVWVNSVPHQRLDGRHIMLNVWETACPDCGRMFLCSTGEIFKAHNRRCGQCRKPGRIPRKKDTTR